MLNTVRHRIGAITSLILLAAIGFLLTRVDYTAHPSIITSSNAQGAHDAINASAHSYASRPGVKSSGMPGVYYGVNVAGRPSNFANVLAFESDAKKAVSIVMWYQGWGVPDSSRYFQPGWMSAVRKHGAIPMVSWEPWNNTQGMYQPSFALQNIINGAFDAYITAWAVASKAWGHPYFLRLAEEMNGDWFPWSEQVNDNRPGQYVLAWRHVHDIFMSVGATNVTWVWSPNVESSGSIPLNELYPGSAYVDWIGMDGYNWSTLRGHHWQSFAQVFQQTYQDILAMNLNKPLIVAETASAEVGGNKAQWIEDAYSIQIPQYFSAIKAVIWFDENKETDWRIESSRAAQTTFASAIASSYYATNRFATMDLSPIPVPE